MSWTNNEFLSILTSSLAEKLFRDEEVASYVNAWRDENKAALLHANGITEKTPCDKALLLLKLVAAFARKDIMRMSYLIEIAKVTVGARLDYFLPLYDANNEGGEDIFVASTKVILGGDETEDISLSSGSLKYKIGSNRGNSYEQVQLKQIEDYVNNSFAIRNLLRRAPNQAVVQPTKDAIKYIIANAKSYRDSNDNPPIVFIPGAISIECYPVKMMIKKLLERGAYVDEIGFFGVPGIVWSIILGDIEGVNTFLEQGARLDIEDEMGNCHVSAWASATYHAVEKNSAYAGRLSQIWQQLSILNRQNKPNNLGFSPLNYFDKHIDQNREDRKNRFNFP